MAPGDSYFTTPSILLFADSDDGRAEQEQLIEKFEGRIAVAAPITAAIEHLDEAVDIGAVVVDARTGDEASLARLLDRLNQAARAGRFMSVVSITPELIDLAATHAPDQNVALLPGAGEIERTTALTLALTGFLPVSPLAREPHHARLMQLSEEVGRIAKTLAALGAPPRGEPGLAAAAGEPLDEPTVATIRSMIRARRLREQFFSSELFADPAWDMLLDLMAARGEGVNVAVSSLCIAAAVPATTALRWIKTLTDEGLFRRVADPHDGRRVFIELSDAAAQGMVAYFHAMARLGLRLGSAAPDRRHCETAVR